MLKADKLVLDQAIKRHREKESRTKREWKIPQGPGWTSVGNILDCNRKVFERALKAYSDRLYVGWNPIKNYGNGCWEVWHRPTVKTALQAYKDDSLEIWTTEYRPNDFEHWVADLPFLRLDFIDRLRKMDAWENKQLISGHDDHVEAEKQRAEEKESQELKYIVKHHKTVFKDLLEYTQQGFNPLQFFNKK